MRIAAVFSDKIMDKFLSKTLIDFGSNNIHILFYNIHRCWSEAGVTDEIFLNFRYILNHHYDGLDVCFDAYHLRYAECEMSRGFHYNHEGSIRQDMRELYEMANRINQYFRENDAQSLWLRRLEDEWISTTTMMAFKEMKALNDLPVVDIDFALQHIGKLISHHAELK